MTEREALAALHAAGRRRTRLRAVAAAFVLVVTVAAGRVAWLVTGDAFVAVVGALMLGLLAAATAGRRAPEMWTGGPAAVVERLREVDVVASGFATVAVRDGRGRLAWDVQRPRPGDGRSLPVPGSRVWMADLVPGEQRAIVEATRGGPVVHFPVGAPVSSAPTPPAPRPGPPDTPESEVARAARSRLRASQLPTLAGWGVLLVVVLATTGAAAAAHELGAVSALTTANIVVITAGQVLPRWRAGRGFWGVRRWQQVDVVDLGAGAAIKQTVTVRLPDGSMLRWARRPSVTTPCAPSGRVWVSLPAEPGARVALFAPGGGGASGAVALPVAPAAAFVDLEAPGSAVGPGR